MGRFLTTLGSAFRALNPVGPIADVILSYIAGKQEARRIEGEMYRISEQARTARKSIAAELELRLKELEARRQAFEAYFGAVEREFAQIRLERTTLLDLVQAVVARIIDPDTEFGERRLLCQTATDWITQLSAHSERAVGLLEGLTRALPGGGNGRTIEGGGRPLLGPPGDA